MNLALMLLAAAAYAGAAYSAFDPARRRWEQGLALAAVAIHALVLARSVFAGHGLLVGVTEALSLLAWQSALLLWLACLWRPLAALGAILYPVAGVTGVLAVLWPSPTAEVSIADWRLQLHIVLSIFSAGLLTLAAAQAVAIASLERVLHRQAGGALTRLLPPLQVMERLLFQLIALGFSGLSLALLTGLIFVNDLFGQHLVHKTVLSIVAWVIFGILLWGQRRYGWRGRSAVRWALAGYGTLIVAYFGSKFVLELLLERHWFSS